MQCEPIVIPKFPNLSGSVNGTLTFSGKGLVWKKVFTLFDRLAFKSFRVQTRLLQQEVINQWVKAKMINGGVRSSWNFSFDQNMSHESFFLDWFNWCQTHRSGMLFGAPLM